MRLQQKSTFRRLDARVGGTETAMLEFATEDPGVWRARTTGEAPEVDGCVLVRDPPRARAGRFVRARIVERAGYDLIARAEK